MAASRNLRFWLRCLGSVLLALWAWGAHSPAAAACSAQNKTITTSYTGVADDVNSSTKITCTNGTLSSGSYAVCTGSPQTGGTGGSSVTPWRTAVDTDGDTLNYQLSADSTDATPLVASQIRLGQITGALIGSATDTITFYADLPVDAAPLNGTYTTTVTMPIDIRSGTSNCSGAVKSSFSFTITVTVTVKETCQILSTTAVNFGTGRTTTTTQIDAVGGIEVTCNSKNTSFTVALDNGLNAVSNQRNVSDGTDQLMYNFYTDVNHTNLWQQSTTVSGKGQNQNISIYARMPAQATPATVGTYNDTVIATVSY